MVKVFNMMCLVTKNIEGVGIIYNFIYVYVYKKKERNKKEERREVREGRDSHTCYVTSKASSKGYT